MNLARRIKRLEEKARAAAFGNLTLAVVRRMMDGTLTEAEWRHYGPILKSLLYPNEVARLDPYEFDVRRGVVVCSPPREDRRLRCPAGNQLPMCAIVDGTV